ncbi:MAG TPA: class I SAM-dependent methyltransferase [Bryobacteraceae bacterium]|jgi:ubiquinone/menaquinone biosynthesis C-methylase UbiE|nr:class I SAM-dependent methyltransferase [Bryobacteraceae bacterium]
MSTPGSAHGLNPGIIFETMTAYQRSAALKAAVDLDLFTQIAKGNLTADALAAATSASKRGVRILCDFLVIIGLLSKEGDQYSLGLEARVFLNRESPAYFGSATRFILDPKLMAPFASLTEIVKNGRTTLPEEGTVSYDNPIWVEFAEAMGPMQFMASQEIAGMVAGAGAQNVLDIAAGHGLFGIAIAQRNPEAKVTALDWANVLAVAEQNAKKMGVADRVTMLPGDAFALEFGGPYDLVLVTNFFHHFDKPTCEGLMEKIYAVLKPGGRCATLDFVPNDDRVTPPAAASFAMMMLGSTASGDAYTMAEYETMFGKAGFASSEMTRLEKSPGALIVSTKA